MSGIRVILLALPLAASAMQVRLIPSAASPAPLGTVVNFEAEVSGADARLSYRFRTRRATPAELDGRRQGEFRTVVDYGPNPSLKWTTIKRDGPYEIELSVRNDATGEAVEDTITFVFSALADTDAVVTPTENPLVFIYSAPPCPEGVRIRAKFARADGGDAATQTPAKDCDGQSSTNFYLAGMRAATDYRAWHTWEGNGVTSDSAPLPYTTGTVSITTPAAAPLSTPVPDYAGILLHGILSQRPIATDLNGNLLWYGPEGLSMFTRVGTGGTMLGIYENGTKEPAFQFFREYDLAGITIAETNAGRVNEQLRAIGARPITSFHHEAIRMPDGKYLVLAGSEQLMDDVQGPGTMNLIGDTILVLDRNLNLVWYWDSFDHMDPTRAALLKETCAYPASLACAVFYGSEVAQDWLHGNSLQLTPDGNILFSVRHHDWVIKIDYSNGAGSGAVLWRLGPDGDFTLADGEQSAWFSHQHDAQILSDGVTMIVYDNGNTRIARNSDRGTSRGQVWRLDEESRTAHLVMNADLKANSPALGSAQLLANGNYHFDSGFIPNPGNPAQRFTQALEVDPSGNIVWGMQITAQEYRNFRLDDLYTPPLL
jgi:arylsulfate sulfotransferase